MITTFLFLSFTVVTLIIRSVIVAHYLRYYKKNSIGLCRGLGYVLGQGRKIHAQNIGVSSEHSKPNNGK